MHIPASTRDPSKWRRAPFNARIAAIVSLKAAVLLPYEPPCIWGKIARSGHNPEKFGQRRAPVDSMRRFSVWKLMYVAKKGKIIVLVAKVVREVGERRRRIDSVAVVEVKVALGGHVTRT